MQDNNNLQYNPVPQCFSCHSEIYWSGFHKGYDIQWDTYNYQSTNQGTSINIYGNGNYVNTAQNSGQSSGSGPGDPNPNPNPPTQQQDCGPNSFGCGDGPGGPAP